MTRIAFALAIVLLCAVAAFAQNTLLTDKAAAFFDDGAVRELRRAA